MKKLINRGIKNFIESKNIINTFHIEEDEMMTSFDVSSSFTNVPIDEV